MKFTIWIVMSAVVGVTALVIAKSTDGLAFATPFLALSTVFSYVAGMAHVDDHDPH